MKFKLPIIVWIILFLLIIVIGIVCIWYIMNHKTENYENTKKYDVLIISAGGGGTTYFIDYLSNNIDLKINHKGDIDGIKHISYDRVNRLNNINCNKIIYLYNDPLLAIKSFYRRQFLRHIHKLGNPHNLSTEYIKNYNMYADLVKNEKKDLYGINEQYDFYMNGDINKDILFVNFNNILKNKKRISEFIGVDSNIFDNFQIKERNSENINTDDDVITQIYKDLFEKIDKMDGKVISASV